MDLDLSSLWSWTLPIWSLILLVFFLVGVQTQEVVFPVHVGGATGGARQEVTATKSRSLR
jgi:hypothetical protein